LRERARYHTNKVKLGKAVMSQKDLVQVALDWAVRCFGAGHVYNRPIRSLRCAEEAVELAQACGVPKKTILKMVDVVYSKAPGEPLQELGGVLLTANLLCAILEAEPDHIFSVELRRVLAKPTGHFTERNLHKIDLGLDA
jgi:hypothetical protein